MSPDEHRDLLLRNIKECRNCQADESRPLLDRQGATLGEVDHLCELQHQYPEEFAKEEARMLARSMEMTL